ncbi:sodium ion-translocating decarboxylase subunit beta [Treponema zioleckii]|uniref:sodium ion-translocating decarboxylase subunit beta n=1 Tax=Treponema zioleckii TaxID=331680 RepID=UPI0018E955EA|nr:sodium ion-translocating decarboxylase subunit beta [Treponema zioleckii]
MIDLKKNYKRQALGVSLAIAGIAFVLSLGSQVLAQSTSEPTNEVVSATSDFDYGTGVDRIIKGTEKWTHNGDKNDHDIAPLKFLNGIWESTGISKIFSEKGAPQKTEANDADYEPSKVNNEPKETVNELRGVLMDSNSNDEQLSEVIEKASNHTKDWGTAPGWQSFLMMAIGFLIVYLGAGRGFEPLLLIPIGFGTILVNAVGAGMGNLPDGMLAIIYKAGVGNEFFPMLIFMGIGAMTDFGPLIANPKTALLGGAAQFGVFFTLFGVAVLNLLGLNYNIMQACAIAIIGGADGPTSIYVSGKLAPELMAVIAVAAYSYMALVPMIQPPIMKLLTTKKQRMIHMDNPRVVPKAEKVLFPMMLLLLTILLLPPAAPLIGCLAFGNFVKESGAAARLSKTMENELMNIVSILLSLGVGSQMTPEKIIKGESVGIIVLGLLAFAIATAAGVCMAHIMNLFMPKGKKINPLIGSAGVSAVPMAARVAHKVAQGDDPTNFILMNAMGPNVSGVIGTAIAAGVFIATYGGF